MTLTLKKFAELSALYELSEIQKVERLAFFLTLGEGQSECNLSDIVQKLDDLNFARPNVSRLAKNIDASKDLLSQEKKAE